MNSQRNVVFWLSPEECDGAFVGFRQLDDSSSWHITTPGIMGDIISKGEYSETSILHALYVIGESS